jgi:ribonuclease P protein component
MISKKNRLTENEVKKVLAKRKPFFSHTMVANVYPNKLGYARIGIVLSAKQTRGSVNRNSFRRMIYDLTVPSLPKISQDIVFLCKKGILLDHKDEASRASIERDTVFLLRTIEKSSK